MGGLGRLAVRRLEVGVDEAADVGAGGGVVEVDSVAARGGDDRLVGTDGDAAHRLDVGRRQRHDDLGPLVREGRRLGALVDPELDEGQLFRRQRRLALRRHGRLGGATAQLDEQTAGRGAGDDRVAAAAALHEQFIAAHVQFALRLDAVVAAGALGVEDRFDVLGVSHRVLAVQLDDRDGLRLLVGGERHGGQQKGGQAEEEAGTHIHLREE